MTEMSEGKGLRDVQAVKDFLPDPLVKLLDFEEYEDWILVRTKQFLHGEQGKKDWGMINKLLKQAEGSWVSAGKQSHWKVPRERGEAKGDERVRRIREAAERILQETEGMI